MDIVTDSLFGGTRVKPCILATTNGKIRQGIGKFTKKVCMENAISHRKRFVFV